MAVSHSRTVLALPCIYVFADGAAVTLVNLSLFAKWLFARRTRTLRRQLRSPPRRASASRQRCRAKRNQRAIVRMRAAARPIRMTPTANPHLDSFRLVTSSSGAYNVRLAVDATDVQRAQALRFQVFNLELNEGLPQSFENQRDADLFDAVCDHLLVEHVPTAQVVGTYRLQTGRRAAKNLGYYSAQEFEFDVFESARGELIELGRACVHRQHRNLVVLGLLWKGIAEYAQQRDARYLIGCSSINSQDPAIGAAAYAELYRRHLAAHEFRAYPRPEYECCLDQLAPDPPAIPKLLRAYLTIGAKICGPPALDREFRTIDFLTLLDLQSVPPLVRSRFLNAL
jgi:putative hemolysin